MGFDLEDTERLAPRWIEYAAGRVSARFYVLPRDEAFVEELNRKFSPEERLTRSGRSRQDPAAAEKRKSWTREYLLHHVTDWDVMAGGQKAPLTAETMAQLTDGMKTYILEATGADDLRDYEAPLPG